MGQPVHLQGDPRAETQLSRLRAVSSPRGDVPVWRLQRWRGKTENKIQVRVLDGLKP